MAKFSYLALNENGKEVSGEVEALNDKDAAVKLRAQSLYVVKVEDGAKARFPMSFGSGKRKREKFSLRQYFFTTDSHKALYFRQMALMLRSGHTAVQSFDMCSKLVERKKISNALRDMSMSIQGGATIAKSMEQHPRVFSPLMTNLVASGEMSGQLDMVHDRLASNLEESVEIKRQLITTMIYPAIILGLCSYVVWLMLAVVVPKFVSFFASHGTELPPLTQMLVTVSNYVVDYGPMTGSIILFLIFATLASYTTEAGKKVIDRILLSTPLIGTTIVNASMARLGVTFAMLLQSGMTVLESLHIMSRVLGNKTLSHNMDIAAESILAGHSMSRGLEQKFIPLMVTHMVSVGEKSGELEAVMMEVGRFYSQLLSASIKRMVAFMEPTLILFVGGVVGFVYLSIFEAIFKASSGG